MHNFSLIKLTVIGLMCYDFRLFLAHFTSEEIWLCNKILTFKTILIKMLKYAFLLQEESFIYKTTFTFILTYVCTYVNSTYIICLYLCKYRMLNSFHKHQSKLHYAQYYSDNNLLTDQTQISNSLFELETRGVKLLSSLQKPCTCFLH